jgi:hypothetical protein
MSTIQYKQLWNGSFLDGYLSIKLEPKERPPYKVLYEFDSDDGSISFGGDSNLDSLNQIDELVEQIKKKYYELTALYLNVTHTKIH